MKILLLGSGGREHALAWKIAQSPLCSRLLIAPGNPGTAQYGVNMKAGVNDFARLKVICTHEHIDMVVVGPEDPLVNGIADFFREDPELQHIRVIGPDRKGAQLEGSKAFAKAFMGRYGIPTAGYREFSAADYEEGVAYIQQHSLPVVLKADGLAAGKGVVIAETHADALQSFEAMLKGKQFGEAGSKVVIEEYLSGIECSVFVLTNGTSYVLMPTAKDYKRIGEGDRGLNTGGMGAISPVPFADEAFMDRVREQIIEPTLKGIQAEGMQYEGFIFFGLMKVGDQPYVIEYNCRLGDPETETILPRIESDLVDLMFSLREGTLAEKSCTLSPLHAATVVLVSQGYPEAYEKGKAMSGLQSAEHTLLFHAGTADGENGLVTNGGRVLAVSSLGRTLNDALQASMQHADQIAFEGKYYRRDIGHEFTGL